MGLLATVPPVTLAAIPLIFRCLKKATRLQQVLAALACVFAALSDAISSKTSQNKLNFFCQIFSGRDFDIFIKLNLECFRFNTLFESTFQAPNDFFFALYNDVIAPTQRRLRRHCRRRSNKNSRIDFSRVGVFGVVVNKRRRSLPVVVSKLDDRHRRTTRRPLRRRR